MADVETLDGKVKTLQLTPAELANGSVELLNEIASSKITGEEERYSHTDLADFQANLDGGQGGVRAADPGAREGRKLGARGHDPLPVRGRADGIGQIQAARRRSGSRSTAP